MNRPAMMLFTFLILGGVSGCMTCHHAACDAALAPAGVGDDRPMMQRNRVHVYILNGNDPVGAGGLCKLRQAINEAGYAKVSYGGLFSSGTFREAIVKTHAEDPEARFILVGNGFGVALAEALAGRLAAAGIHAEAVVALSPLTLPGLGENSTSYSGTLTTIDATDARTIPLVTEIVAQACQAIPPQVEIAGGAIAMIDDPAPRPGIQRTLVEATPIPTRPTPRLVPGILTTMPKP